MPDRCPRPHVTTLLTANNQSPRVLGLHAQSKMPIEKGNRCKVDYATLAKYNKKHKTQHHSAKTAVPQNHIAWTLALDRNRDVEQHSAPAQGLRSRLLSSAQIAKRAGVTTSSEREARPWDSWMSAEASTELLLRNIVNQIRGERDKKMTQNLKALGCAIYRATLLQVHVT